MYHFPLLPFPPHTTPCSLSNSWPPLSLLLLVSLLMVVCCILKPINTTFTIYLTVCIYGSGLTVWYWRINCCFLPSLWLLLILCPLMLFLFRSCLSRHANETFWVRLLMLLGDKISQQMCQSSSSKNLFVLTSKMTSEPYV